MSEPERDLLPPSDARFETLAQSAIRKWCPEGDAKDNVVLHRMKAGRSGAAVYKLDVRCVGNEIDPGQYILKLDEAPKWDDQDDEATAHRRAIERDASFAARHVPNIKDVHAAENGYAILYDIAGQSLRFYSSSDVPECPGFLEASSEVVLGTLNAWSNQTPARDLTPSSLLDEWLGYRLKEEPPTRLREFVGERFRSEKGTVISGMPILNPIWFYEYAKQSNWGAEPVLDGLLHGDLHGGNLVISRTRPESDFWIIDFGLSKDAQPIGYDQAYLEVFLILTNLAERDPADLVSLMKVIDTKSTRNIPLRQPGMRLWLEHCLKTMRKATDDWIGSTHPTRRDELTRQFALARVAAAMNWVNKPLDSDGDRRGNNQRYLALICAGLAAQDYVERFEIDSLDAIWRDTYKSGSSSAAPSLQDRELWDQFLHKAGNLHANDRVAENARYILIAEGLGDDERLRALGNIPWSLAVDLDPNSDETGLFRNILPVLETRRKVHPFRELDKDLEMSRALLVRGTAWMMVNGWSMKGELPKSFDAWRYEKLPLLRRVFKEFDSLVNPEPIYAVVIPGAGIDSHLPMERLNRVVAALEEATRGSARIILLGTRTPTVQVSDHIPLDTSVFFELASESLGISMTPIRAIVPAKDGAVEIPTDMLRAMEENFTLLHSDILLSESDASSEELSDAFWRGRPPNWVDLHGNVDILRKFHSTLVDELTTALSQKRNRTIVLFHNPGSGGTTTSLRAAWDLRHTHPTAVLHTYSPSLADRLESLYGRVHQPILFVAEWDTLTEARREDLYRELSAKNVRCVLLYLRRVYKTVHKSLFIPESLDDDEAKVFFAEYSQQTESKLRLKELHKITHQETHREYRSPFFYGLITFARDFLGTESYVQSHMEGVRGKVRDVLEYLALATIYAKKGVHQIIIRRLVHPELSDKTTMSVSDLLGEQVARLVVLRNGHLRLVHQLIAEEVLQRSIGGKERGDWKRRGLKDLAIDFIHDLARVVDADSEPLLEMLRQMFVARSGRGVDDAEDREDFAPLIEDVDAIDKTLGHRVLEELTDSFPGESHFWNHRGRHHIYRMQRDFDEAERHLLLAISLAPFDFIHPHTLGLVRRSQVRRELKHATTADLTLVLNDIETYFDGAAEAFGKSRDLKPDNMYGYITHIQLILGVLDRFKRLTGVNSIAQLSSDVQEWVQNQVSVANELIERASELYGTLDRQDEYLTRCQSDMRLLHGRFDETILLWEVQLEHNPESCAARRSLAHAFLLRVGNRFRSLEQAELQRIRKLMELNLRSPGRRDDDYRLWFEAYRLLPDFDIDEALSRLKVWSDAFPSWRAHYYTYVLHWLLWCQRRVESLAEFHEALGESSRLFIGRRGYSHLWHGYKPSPCPLASTSDLGEFKRADDRSESFWEHTDNLRRVNGSIDEIRGAQAGWIDIGGQIRAFFVPGQDFSRDNLNEKVNFFLGFSPSEPRAWSVERGHVPEGNARPLGDEDRVTLAGPLPSPVLAESAKQEIANNLRMESILEFVTSIVSAKTRIGAEITLDELRTRVEAAFHLDDLFELRGVHDLAEWLRRAELFELIEGEGYTSIKRAGMAVETESTRRRQRKYGWIRNLDRARQFGFIGVAGEERDYHFRFVNVAERDRQSLEPGSIVEFTPDENEIGPMAIGTELVDRERLLPYVQRKIEDLVNQAGGSYPLKDLHDEVVRQFGGADQLLTLLQVEKFSSLINEMARMRIAGRFPDFKVEKREEAPFAPLPREKPGATQGRTSAATDLTKEQVERIAVEFVNQRSADGQTTLTNQLGYHLVKETELPALELYPKIGCRGFRDFIEGVAELETVGEHPRVYVKLAEEPVAPWVSSDTLARAAIDFVSERSAMNKDVLATALGAHLVKVSGMRASELYPRLGFSGFRDFVEVIEEIKITGDHPHRYVELTTRKRKSVLKSRKTRPSTRETSTHERAKSVVIAGLREHGGRATIQRVGVWLSQELPGQGPIANRLGLVGQSLADWASEIAGVEVAEEPPNVIVTLVSNS